MAVTKQKSKSVSDLAAKERKDERVLRTRKRIDAAFVQILYRRPYGDIRVSDITRKAGIGRATFYAHYPHKDDLLRSQFERMVAPMIGVSSQDPAVLDATAFFAHIRDVSVIYRFLMGPGAGNAPRVLRDCLEARISRLFGLDRKKTGRLEETATSRFVAAALLALAECWIEKGSREAPQEVQVVFSKLVNTALGQGRSIRDLKQGL